MRTQASGIGRALKRGLLTPAIFFAGPQAAAFSQTIWIAEGARVSPQGHLGDEAKPSWIGGAQAGLEIGREANWTFRLLGGVSSSQLEAATGDQTGELRFTFATIQLEAETGVWDQQILLTGGGGLGPTFWSASIQDQLSRLQQSGRGTALSEVISLGVGWAELPFVRVQLRGRAVQGNVDATFLELGLQLRLSLGS